MTNMNKYNNIRETLVYNNKFIGETRFWHSFSNEHKNKIINVLQTMNHKPYSKMATILILFIFKLVFI